MAQPHFAPPAKSEAPLFPAAFISFASGISVSPGESTPSLCPSGGANNAHPQQQHPRRRSSSSSTPALGLPSAPAHRDAADAGGARFLNDDVVEIICAFLPFALAHQRPALWAVAHVSRQFRRCALQHGISALGLRQLATSPRSSLVIPAYHHHGRAASSAALPPALMPPDGAAAPQPRLTDVELPLVLAELEGSAQQRNDPPLTAGMRGLQRQFGVGGGATSIAPKGPSLWLAFALRTLAEVVRTAAVPIRFLLQLYVPSAYFAPPFGVLQTLRRAFTSSGLLSMPPTTAQFSPGTEKPPIVVDAICTPIGSPVTGADHAPALLELVSDRARAVPVLRTLRLPDTDDTFPLSALLTPIKNTLRAVDLSFSASSGVTDAVLLLPRSAARSAGCRTWRSAGCCRRRRCGSST